MVGVLRDSILQIGPKIEDHFETPHGEVLTNIYEQVTDGTGDLIFKSPRARHREDEW